MPCHCGKHRTSQGCAGSRTLARLPVEKRTRPKRIGPRRRVHPRTGPLCRCGCGRRCLKHAKYASQACVPRSVRVGAMIAGWRKVSQRNRALRFKADIDRLLGNGKVSRDDLMAFAHDLYERGYQAAIQRERRQRREAA